MFEKAAGAAEIAAKCSRRLMTGFQHLGTAFLKGHVKCRMRRNFATGPICHRSSWLVAGDNATTRHRTTCSRPRRRR